MSILLQKCNKEKVLPYIILCLAFFGLGYKVNYQPDIYLRVTESLGFFKELIINRDGRVICFAILYLLRWLARGDFKVFYYMSLLISFAIITIASFRYGNAIIQKEYARYSDHTCSRGQNIIIALLSWLTIANLFSIEFFLYADMMVGFNLAIWFCIEAVIVATDWIRNKCFISIVKIFLLILVSDFLYETISSLYIILLLPLVLKCDGDFFDFVKRQFVLGMPWGMALLSKLIFTKFVIRSERANFNQNSIADAVAEYVPEGKSPQQFILDRITFGMWGYAVLCLVVGSILVFYVIKNKRYVELLKGLYMVLVTLALGLMPFIARLTDDYKPRIYYPLGALLGILIFYGILIGTINLPQTVHVKSILNCILCIFALIHWLSFVQIYVDCYTTNYEDQYISEMIQERITEYEKISGVKVEKVVFYEDAIRTKYCSQGWCLTQRAYASWANLSALNYFTGNEYTKGTADMDIANEFNQRNWDTFSSEQLVFKDNCVHISMY